jgi:hypothetical protein
MDLGMQHGLYLYFLPMEILHRGGALATKERLQKMQMDIWHEGLLIVPGESLGLGQILDPPYALRHKFLSLKRPLKLLSPDLP